MTDEPKPDEPKHIVWIEIKTNGASDQIEEIAAAVTDASLEMLGDAPNLVAGDVADLEAKTIELLGEHVAKGAAPLGGDSAQRVRHLLRTHMPELYDFLHYRSVDLVTIRELARRWYPNEVAAMPPRNGGPRAIDEVRASIDELRYYRANVFK